MSLRHISHNQKWSSVPHRRVKLFHIPAPTDRFHKTLPRHTCIYIHIKSNAERAPRALSVRKSIHEFNCGLILSLASNSRLHAYLSLWSSHIYKWCNAGSLPSPPRSRSFSFLFSHSRVQKYILTSSSASMIDELFCSPRGRGLLMFGLCGLELIRREMPRLFCSSSVMTREVDEFNVIRGLSMTGITAFQW